MKKYCKALSIALALFMVLNVLAPIKADAKTTVWKQTEAKYYYLNYDSGKLELSTEEKTEFDSKGNKTKYTFSYYMKDSETGKKTKNTSVTKYAYKNNKLYKITYDEGGYAIYTWKKNNYDKIKYYNKDKKLVSEEIYTYNSKGQITKCVTKEDGKVIGETLYTYDKKGDIAKYVSKHNGKKSYETTYKNGIPAKSTSYTEMGKISWETTYDKYGYPVKEANYTYDYETGKKTGSSTTTYKNTYVKGKISKVDGQTVHSNGGKDKSEAVYYTSGVADGRQKTYKYYWYNMDTKKYELSYSYHYKYKGDKAGNIVEETTTNDDGKVTSKTTYKYKKFTY